MKSWTGIEVGRLIAAVASTAPGLVPMVVTLANTGMRCGEALALRWESVNLERRILGVWPSSEWSTKSGKPREVPINDTLLRLLRALPRRGPYVFPSRTGRRYARWPQNQFDRAVDAARLTGGPHRLRHTYAAEFLSRGGSLSQLAQILGHSDERVTRLYAHLRPDHLQAVRNLVTFTNPADGPPLDG